MVDIGTPPTPEQVAYAKADYQRAVEILLADQRATELRVKRALVGHYFKHIERLPEDPSRDWVVYIVAVTVHPESGLLAGWHFQQAATGQIELGLDSDLKPGFLADECVAIARAEFVAAFNELLTAITRFANRIPV